MALAVPARAGITVTSYSTVALTNGFAPVSGSDYFARQELLNVSPATAEVSGDWMGPNADGTPDTWHFVGSSSVSSTTTFDTSSFRATASGSFAYESTTTADFVGPRSASIFTPGGAANYVATFHTDVAYSYSVTAQLNQLSVVRLGTPSGFIFNEFNLGTVPTFVNLSGTLLPGQYMLVISTGLGASNFPMA